MILILFIGLAMIIWIGSYYLHIFSFPKPSVYQYITLVLITVVQPLVIFNLISRNYRSSNYLTEPLEVKILRDGIKMRGESFFTEINWDKIYKIVEYKNWFLIYQNTLSAIIIPKNVFDDNQLDQFTNILKSIKNVPVHLKNN
jgi:hypothetical protein